MCRFMIYKGREPMVLSDLLTKPAHSIINQSFDSRLRLDMRNPINGDGFGVGYYSTDEPCIFKAITPAWNNVNLNNLSMCTKSRLVFGHVRASTQGVLSETNCHPFAYGKLMFMHNGGISLFEKLKRKLVDHLDDEYFLYIQGATDSECCFALYLNTLHQMGYNPGDKNEKFTHNILRQALVTTTELIKNWQVAITDEPSLLNFAVTDGESIVVSRYITSKTDEAASLHFSTGSRFFEYEPGLFKMERLNRSQDVIFVASEPLTFERGDWICVPTNTMLTITNNNTVLMHPIEDEFYDRGVSERSSGLAMSKGLMGGVPTKNGTGSASVGSTLAELPPLSREGRKPSTEYAVF
ncbi:glucosamine 6-phosphate synthetase [Suhomyces tanzawaensis NRRL Y-17324]|uniref:Glucosamine 6-phosphate synthetase n=1 Tax=Suhomyces tanzawaensis NRRL Y-17324 TaxID=984487 RepID=A0A1E4SM46_9ASCO|nr:glucosamine 6-phosphate synthetase [Suhomyces tanzawaensis NRRL Y-17324]ODV80599.1 glucosamine 6-phosphate synthetase [Suhomyces tanzawaensis NRRL Y-17324]